MFTIRNTYRTAETLTQSTKATMVQRVDTANERESQKRIRARPIITIIPDTLTWRRSKCWNKSLRICRSKTSWSESIIRPSWDKAPRKKLYREIAWLNHSVVLGAHWICDLFLYRMRITAGKRDKYIFVGFLILSVKFNDASLLKINDELVEFHGNQTHVH